MKESPYGQHALTGAFMPHTLTPLAKEEWEERAAILEYDAGITPRWEAELMAANICKARWVSLQERSLNTPQF